MSCRIHSEITFKSVWWGGVGEEGEREICHTGMEECQDTVLVHSTNAWLTRRRM